MHRRKILCVLAFLCGALLAALPQGGYAQRCFPQSLSLRNCGLNKIGLCCVSKSRIRLYSCLRSESSQDAILSQAGTCQSSCSLQMIGPCLCGDDRRVGLCILLETARRSWLEPSPTPKRGRIRLVVG